MGFTNVVIWSPGETLEQLEERVVKAAVDLAAGDKYAAAKALGVTPQTIYNHLEKYQKRDRELELNRKAQGIVMAEHTRVPDGNMPPKLGGERGSFDGNGKFNKAKNG